jgi:uncharacterized protein
MFVFLIIFPVKVLSQNFQIPISPLQRNQTPIHNIDNLTVRINDYKNSNLPLRDSEGNLLTGIATGRIQYGSSGIVENNYYDSYSINASYIFKDGLPHGEFTHTFNGRDNRGSRTNQVVVKGTYHNGKENGLYEEFYNNGQLKLHVQYQDGNRVGAVNSYHMNGQFNTRATYENGKLNGILVRYHDNGQEWYRIRNVNGIIITTSLTQYNSDGNIHIQGTIDSSGRWVGNNTMYHDNGNINIKSFYKDGKRDGTVEVFNASGTLESRHVYSNGIKNGQFELFHSNGRLKEKGYYQNGKRHGRFESFNENGKRDRRGNYDNGIFSSSWF